MEEIKKLLTDAAKEPNHDPTIDKAIAWLNSCERALDKYEDKDMKLINEKRAEKWLKDLKDTVNHKETIKMSEMEDYL